MPNMKIGIFYEKNLNYLNNIFDIFTKSDFGWNLKPVYPYKHKLNKTALLFAKVMTAQIIGFSNCPEHMLNMICTL